MRFGRYIFRLFGFKNKHGTLIEFTRGTKVYTRLWWRVYTLRPNAAVERRPDNGGKET